MNSQPLYDLTPLASLLGLGALLALGPLAWVYWRNRRSAPLQRLQALRLFTLFLTFDLILFGAFTRLTDSGLGCPDWPGCYGNTSPLGAHHAITAAQDAMPSGPVTRAKAWIEMIHRYLATGVGALIMVLAAASWLRWRASVRADIASHLGELSPWWVTLTLFWVCLQGAFGAWTVTWKLFPAIVTLHLGGALVLLALLGVLVVRGSTATVPLAMSLTMRRWVALVFALLALQILLGGWVSTNYAVLACSDFPQCQNRWWPEMNFQQGFELWRHLGVTGTGEPISFAALTAIHYVHRLVAYLVLTLLAVLAWQLNRLAAWRAHSRVLAALVGLQLATGLSNVVLDWPLWAALLHTGGSAALVLTLTWIAASAAPVTKAAVPATRRARAAVTSDNSESGRLA
ncbi:COX15/CtaA family protein [Rhodoferax sp.]|uniref:COX15/CtaA family protein n=1 Tax=Rhodoferax sp. TaxID=50421 RepID=UPI002612A54C|nr:COX15/CtaA family protein [Rhodoferax sp.]MDD2918145.1 COX15/CtaA family protein [Rhodoferax sp.]